MNTWSQVLARIEQVVDRSEYDTWLAPTRSVGQKADQLDIAVPSQRYADEIRERFGLQIRAYLNEITLEPVNVNFIVQGNGPDPAPIAPPKDEIPTATFNPRYRFDTFVVGGSNQLAYAASKSIAENPSGSFNPLFIYGGAGLGKTHLIQAIGHQLRSDRTGMKVVYMSAEVFVTEVIAAIRYDRMQPFRDKYRSIDALLLDDIQFIAGKERTQEEFFHTFNALYEAQKQIVFTSDRPPKEIPTLEERLRSRFEWGLTADIQPPDLETKAAIMRKKAEAERVEIPENVALFIASKVRTNIRELEGSLIRLIAYASLTGREIDLVLAQEVLKDLLQTEDKPITIEMIQKFVADHYNVKLPELKAKNNAKAVSHPRQIAMYLAKSLTNASLPEIGKSFGGKHHSTVIHSIKKIQDERKNNSEFDRLINSFVQAFR